MKAILKIFIITFLFLCLSCNKSEIKAVEHINCKGLVTDTIGNMDSALIFVPNAFTPNADGLNDVFGPVTVNISSLVFEIYDDNNHIVFSSDSLNANWTPMTTAKSAQKFYYKIQAKTRLNNNLGICGEVYKMTCIPKDLSKSSLRFADQIDPSKGFIYPTMEIISSCP